MCAIIRHATRIPNLIVTRDARWSTVALCHSSSRDSRHALPFRGRTFGVKCHVPHTRGRRMSATNERTGKRKKASLVLVVEDDADLREMVRLTLAGAGYAVTEAADGAEALR